jgi:hypothetical protein
MEAGIKKRRSAVAGMLRPSTVCSVSSQKLAYPYGNESGVVSRMCRNIFSGFVIGLRQRIYQPVRDRTGPLPETCAHRLRECRLALQDHAVAQDL